MPPAHYLHVQPLCVTCQERTACFSGNYYEVTKKGLRSKGNYLLIIDVKAALSTAQMKIESNFEPVVI